MRITVRKYRTARSTYTKSFYATKITETRPEELVLLCYKSTIKKILLYIKLYGRGYELVHVAECMSILVYKTVPEKNQYTKLHSG